MFYIVVLVKTNDGETFAKHLPRKHLSGFTVKDSTS